MNRFYSALNYLCIIVCVIGLLSTFRLLSLKPWKVENLDGRLAEHFESRWNSTDLASNVKITEKAIGEEIPEKAPAPALATPKPIEPKKTKPISKPKIVATPTVKPEPAPKPLMVKPKAPAPVPAAKPIILAATKIPAPPTTSVFPPQTHKNTTQNTNKTKPAEKSPPKSKTQTQREKTAPAAPNKPTAISLSSMLEVDLEATASR